MQEILIRLNMHTVIQCKKREEKFSELTATVTWIFITYTAQKCLRSSCKPSQNEEAARQPKDSLFLVIGWRFREKG